jgi:CubicO group peptidase (beta-lactamase class C family)
MHCSFYIKLLFSSLLFINIISCEPVPDKLSKISVKDTILPLDTVKIPNLKEKQLKIHNYFIQLCKNTRFNGAILIAQRGKIIYKNYYGYLNYKDKDTLTINSRFQIGSASKTFTAAAIMLLKDRKLLDYTDEVTKFIPEFPYRGITVKHLLSHRSGLSNYIYFCEEYTDRNTTISNEDVIKVMIKNHPKPYFQPNERFNYSNTNYIVLALIVERITKMPFRNFLKTQIFQPLHMDSTFVLNYFAKDTLENVATGYHYKWEEALHVYTDGVVGDKDVYTTIDDLFRWDRALKKSQLIKSTTLQEAFKPSSPGRLGIKKYGMGFRLLIYDNHDTIAYHGGWWRGFTSLFMRIMKDDITIIMMSSVRAEFTVAYSDILNILVPSRIKKAVEISESLDNKNGKR